MKDVIYRDDVVREFIKLFGCIQDVSDIDEWADICQTTMREIPSIKILNNAQTIDLINRADAIELCAEAQGGASTKSELKGISKIWQGLLKLPSADDEWIPFSEGLPEEHAWVGTKKFGTTISDKVHITFDVNGERFVRTLSLQNGELSNYEKRTMDTLHKGWKMIAWMPLPKPYKGGDDE